MVTLLEVVYIKFQPQARELKYTYCGVLSITESSNCNELSISGGSSYRQNPGRDILNGQGARAAVASGARSENPSSHSVECSDGNWVGEEVLCGPSDGNGKEVDAVRDGLVEAREHVHVAAAGSPAHLVHSQAGRWNATPRRAFANAVQTSAFHHYARRGRRRVSAVTRVVRRTHAVVG